MTDSGWVKIHRKMLDNAIVMKDADHLAVWMYLLLNATYDSYSTTFGGKKIELHAGQLITGRKKIAKALGINEHKVERVLKAFKNEHQIEHCGKPYGSLISIVAWDKYQLREQQDEQRMSNDRATSEQRVSTIQESKERKEGEERKEYYSSSSVQKDEKRLDYINEIRTSLGLAPRSEVW